MAFFYGRCCAWPRFALTSGGIASTAYGLDRGKPTFDESFFGLRGSCLFRTGYLFYQFCLYGCTRGRIDWTRRLLRLMAAQNPC